MDSPTQASRTALMVCAYRARASRWTRPLFVDPWAAMLPPAIFIVLHMIEANVITPLVIGHRLTINPLLILVSLSFWAWVWGTTGALLAVPLLIIFKTVFAAAGTPDIAGFLFEDGTLTHVGEEEEKDG